MRFTRNMIIFWSLLLVLAGCSSGNIAPQQPTATHSVTTSTPVVSLTATSTVRSYQPNDHDPFQANFLERAPQVPCPATSRPTAGCFDVTGVGNSIPYGSISFSSFDINYVGPNTLNDPNGCEPTTRQGSISIGNDMVQFTASGTWCVNLVHFGYQVTGGTGKFRQAHGKGSIYIPDPLHNLVEYWTGTLVP